jgi:Tol biopolymer transport system component
MADERLIRSLRVIDAPGVPRHEFVEDLHGLLSTELGFPMSAGTRVEPVIHRLRPRGRSGLALLAAAVLLGVAFVASGIIGVPPPVDPRTSPSPSASSSPTVAPTASPGATPTRSLVPSPTSVAPSILALRGSGRVVFEQIDLGRGGVTRLRYLETDGTAPELMPGTPGVQDTPAWTADGSRLAFSGYDPADPTAQPEIRETDVSGAVPRLITTDCEPPVCLGETDPAYSADGTRLAFVRTGGPTGDASRTSVLAIRDLRTGSVVELASTRTDAASRSHRHPRWSPDGSRIAFGTTTWDSSGFGAGSVVSIIDADGTGLRPVTEPSVQGGDPDWSPDGSLILVSSQPIKSFMNQLGWDNARMRIYTVRPDGTELQRLDSNGAVGSASWSSEGSQILFVRHTGTSTTLGPLNVWVMEADGTAILPIAVTNTCCRWYPVHQPTP